MKIKNGRITPISNCVVRGAKKLGFIKEQEGCELLSRLGIRTYFKQNSFGITSFILNI